MSMKSLMLTAVIGLSSLTLASGAANAGTFGGSPGGYFGPIYTNVYSDGPGRPDRDRYDKRRSGKRDHRWDKDRPNHERPHISRPDREKPKASRRDRRPTRAEAEDLRKRRAYFTQRRGSAN